MTMTNAKKSGAGQEGSGAAWGVPRMLDRSSPEERISTCPRSDGSSAHSSRPRPCRWCWRPAGRSRRLPAICRSTKGHWGNWVNVWRREHPKPEPETTPVERARVAEMEDEIRRLRLENEFLKRAAAFFARTQD